MPHRTLALVVLLAVTGCVDDSTGITAADVACPTASTLTYTNYGSAFMTAHCTECHDTESPRLTTQAEVQAATSRILDAAVYHSSMPENGSLTLAQRTELGQWLSCGAP